MSSCGVFAKMPDDNSIENFEKQKTEKYVKYTYDKFSFRKVNKLSFEAFKYAFTGYLNMVEAGKIKANSLLTICDFTLSSNVKRLWTLDIQRHKVVFNTLVAHGMGTGEEFATAFSNTPDSHQSSLGFYITGENYMGDNGVSMKLHGVDGIFNSNAFDRAIVMHGAAYVSEQFARDNQRLGRSHGCPAVPAELAPGMIGKLENGSCLFIYYTSKKYLANSYWINNKIKNLPADANYMDLQMVETTNPRYKPDAVVVEPCKNTDNTYKIDAPTTTAAPKKQTKEAIEKKILDNVSAEDKLNYKVSVKTMVLSKEEVELLKKRKQINTPKPTEQK